MDIQKLNEIKDGNFKSYHVLHPKRILMKHKITFIFVNTYWERMKTLFTYQNRINFTKGICRNKYKWQSFCNTTLKEDYKNNNIYTAFRPCKLELTSCSAVNTVLDLNIPDTIHLTPYV